MFKRGANLNPSMRYQIIAKHNTAFQAQAHITHANNRFSVLNNLVAGGNYMYYVGCLLLHNYPVNCCNTMMGWEVAEKCFQE